MPLSFLNSTGKRKWNCQPLRAKDRLLAPGTVLLCRGVSRTTIGIEHMETSGQLWLFRNMKQSPRVTIMANATLSFTYKSQTVFIPSILFSAHQAQNGASEQSARH